MLFMSVAQQPKWGLGRLTVVASRSHTLRNTQPVGLLWMISPSQRLLHTQHTTQDTNIHAPSGIWPRDHSNQAASDLRLRPHGHRDRPNFYLKRRILLIRNQWSHSLRFCSLVIPMLLWGTLFFKLIAGVSSIFSHYTCCHSPRLTSMKSDRTGDKLQVLTVTCLGAIQSLQIQALQGSVTWCTTRVGTADSYDILLTWKNHDSWKT
jgi:hypothetical protein